MTYKQLNKEQREVIQILINKKENFTTIGNSIKVDRTTVSKEIPHHWTVFYKLKIRDIISLT